jgi:hypothetical protein
MFGSGMPREGFQGYEQDKRKDDNQWDEFKPHRLCSMQKMEYQLIHLHGKGQI